MLKKLMISLAILTLVIPMAFADVDNFFSVKDNEGDYEAVPGEEITIDFTIANKDLVSPKSVRVYLDPCPVGWDCEDKTLSFLDTGIHAVNLTIDTPKTAIPKKYTFYILLDSDSMTRRGNDRVILDVLSAKQAVTLSYKEYLAKQELQDAQQPEGLPPEAEREAEPVPELYVEDEDVPVEADVESEPDEPKTDIIPLINESEIIEGVERLESSRHFVEYASIVLGVLLVFIAAGAYVSYRKNK